MLEQPYTSAEQHGCQMKLHLVHEPGTQSLPNDARANSHGDVPFTRGSGRTGSRPGSPTAGSKSSAKVPNIKT